MCRSLGGGLFVLWILCPATSVLMFLTFYDQCCTGTSYSVILSKASAHIVHMPIDYNTGAKGGVYTPQQGQITRVLWPKSPKKKKNSLITNILTCYERVDSFVTLHSGHVENVSRARYTNQAFTTGPIMGHRKFIPSPPPCHEILSTRVLPLFQVIFKLALIVHNCLCSLLYACYAIWNIDKSNTDTM